MKYRDSESTTYFEHATFNLILKLTEVRKTELKTVICTMTAAFKQGYIEDKRWINTVSQGHLWWLSCRYFRHHTRWGWWPLSWFQLTLLAGVARQARRQSAWICWNIMWEVTSSLKPEPAIDSKQNFKSLFWNLSSANHSFTYMLRNICAEYRCCTHPKWQTERNKYYYLCREIQ